MKENTLENEKEEMGPGESRSDRKRGRENAGTLRLFVGIAFISFIFGTLGALWAPRFLEKLGVEESVQQTPREGNKKPPVFVRERVVEEDSLVVDIVAKASPAVVSIVVSTDVTAVTNNPFFNSPFFFPNQIPPNGPGTDSSQTERQRVGSGTGFFVSADGLIVTNKHVVKDEGAIYTVLLDGGKEERMATVLARDPVKDLAILKIEGTGFPMLELGDSDLLKTGQTVVAIGNSLGEFSNSVSKGIISGLGRDVTAGSGFGDEELLSDIIQTDAAINPGNSGGPLLDISGKVVGINVATARGAENIGFALPSNQLKRIVEDVKATGKISVAYMGVRYALLDARSMKENNLPFDYGALVLRGTEPSDLAVLPGSPADKAGIVEGDILLEVEGQKIDTKLPLGNILAQYRPGDSVTVKVWRKGETKDVRVTLEERRE